MKPMIEQLILVDAEDREVGTAEKIDAHRRGLRHRAFSVIIWDSAGRQLLQKRSAAKYHSGGLWTNACCGHPRPGEPVAAAAQRRLGEEMGFNCPLEWLGIVQYHAAFDNGLCEHEVVHVFRGCHDGSVAPDLMEAEAHQWLGLEKFVKRSPLHLTASVSGSVSTLQKIGRFNHRQHAAVVINYRNRITNLCERTHQITSNAAIRFRGRMRVNRWFDGYHCCDGRGAG